MDSLPGLHLNVSKTVAYAPHITKPFYIEGIRVSNELVKYLGVWVGDSAECQDKMFTDVLSKIHKVATKWRHRTLTLSAWVLVLKCMIFSVSIHTFTNVFFSNEMLETLQHVANDFLWRGQNRLKQQKCWNTPKWSGLNHLHVKQCIYNLHICWMTRDTLGQSLPGNGLHQFILSKLSQAWWPVMMASCRGFLLFMPQF